MIRSSVSNEHELTYMYKEALGKLRSDTNARLKHEAEERAWVL